MIDKKRIEEFVKKYGGTMDAVRQAIGDVDEGEAEILWCALEGWQREIEHKVNHPMLRGIMQF